MALPVFTAGTTALAADVTSIVTHLQGGSSSTDAWHFRVSTGNEFLVTLADAAGARKFSIRDSAAVEVFKVDSDGNVTISGTLTLSGAAIFPLSASPAPTTEGQNIWDTDDNLLAVGDGVATKLIIPTPTTTAGDMEYASGARAHSRVAIGTTGQVWSVNSGATAPEWAYNSLATAAQGFVESGTNKGFWGFGIPANGAAAWADTAPVGMGGRIKIVGTGTMTPSTTPLATVGAWRHFTTTSGDHAGLVGPEQAMAVGSSVVADMTMVWRGVLTSAAAQVQIIGFGAAADFLDNTNIIAFRVNGTGTIQGVCDAAGSETTRDTSVTPNGTTEITLRVEVRSAGTIVRFYKDNAQVGADVTTNIPPGGGSLYPLVGISDTDANDSLMYTYDAYGWREVGNT